MNGRDETFVVYGRRLNGGFLSAKWYGGDICRGQIARNCVKELYRGLRIR